MNATDRKEIYKLMKHIESCPSLPSDSFVSRTVLHRLQQKLNQNENRIAQPQSCKKRRTTLDRILVFIRTLIVDIPLTLLFISAITSHLAYKYYTNYITPMIEAANWADNDRLQSEFTYYVRQCDVSDITTDNIKSVTLDESKDDVDDAVETFMVHGMGLFKNILDEKVSDDLRTYIRKRNSELKDNEIIPLDTPELRSSFGIGEFIY